MLKRLILISALFFATSAQGETHNGQFALGGELGPAFAAPWAQPAVKNFVAAGPRYSIFARHHYASYRSGFELSLNQISFRGGDLSSTSLLGSYFYRFDPSGRWHPTLAFGIGHSWAQRYFSQGSYNAPIFRLRVGLEYEWKPGWDFVLHLDHFSLFRNLREDPDLHALSASVGFVRYFGKARELPADHAPVPSAAALPLAQLQDGDKDGVADADDKCPNTAEGMRVNALGCGEGQRFNQLVAVNFADGKVALPPGAEASLAPILALLEKHVELKAEIQGHTDATGPEANNLKLSQARAEAIRKYLISQGIAAPRITATGYGSSRPIAANNSPAELERNRRIVVRFFQ
jgi:outer membrane protein OmpA-like peptidoglycan-associated protein